MINFLCSFFLLRSTETFDDCIFLHLRALCNITQKIQLLGNTSWVIYLPFRGLRKKLLYECALLSIKGGGGGLGA